MTYIFFLEQVCSRRDEEKIVKTGDCATDEHISLAQGLLLKRKIERAKSYANGGILHLYY